MIYSANGKGAWPPVATERELHVGLMLSPQKCLLWLSCVAEVTVWMVLKRNLGIKCALFTIDWLLGLGQGFLTQFQRIAWKLLGKLELYNLFLPISPVSYPMKDLPHNTSFSSVTKSNSKYASFFVSFMGLIVYIFPSPTFPCVRVTLQNCFSLCMLRAIVRSWLAQNKIGIAWHYHSNMVPSDITD